MVRRARLPPHAPFGREGLRLPVVGGKVAVAGVGEKERAVLLEDFNIGDQEELAVLDLLITTASCEDKLWWHRQLVWTLSWHLDRVLAQVLLEEAVRPGVRGANEGEGEKQLTRYLVAHKQRLMEGRNWAVCMDAGRVGLKTVFSGVVVRPDNVGMIYPPQAAPSV